MESLEDINELLAVAFGYYQETDIHQLPAPFTFPPLSLALRGYLEFAR